MPFASKLGGARLENSQAPDISLRWMWYVQLHKMQASGTVINILSLAG